MFFLYFLKNFLNKRKLKNIELVILDVDGVLTDGKLTYHENGTDSKNFNVRDGLGIKLLQNEKIKVAFLSGNKSSSTVKRAKDLNIIEYFIGIKNKLEIIEKIKSELKIKKEKILYCGDDLNDLVVIDQVNIFACPRDASPRIKAKSHIILNKNGGDGAVRELCEIILKKRKLLSKYYSQGFAQKN